MNTDSDPRTAAIIGAAYRVHNELGPGFLESVYVRALSIELARDGIAHETEVALKVHYQGVLVGEFRADFLVAGETILEIKAVGSIVPAHVAQLLNYLRAGKKTIGLVINFGARVDIKRCVL